MENSYARTPKQARSKQSYDRMLDAATEIINEGGLQALTLAEVSRRSKVSIGSIYCRVDGKEALLREVQARTLALMGAEFAMMLTRVRRRGLGLRELVPTMVRELALYLRRHSRLLSAFMQQAPSDIVISNAGRKKFQQTALDYKLILLEHKDEIQHPEPERAVEMCFTLAYSCLARYLGLGSLGVNEGNWNELVEDIGLMSLAYLVVDLRQVTRATAK